MVDIDFSQVKLRYAKRGDDLVGIRSFDHLRGTTKGRPTDLTCPECEAGVVIVLAKPPEHKIADHFRHDVDADCVISRSGESATHLNAKVFLSQKLNQFHRASLVYQCVLCRNWYSFFRIEGYDYAKPELKVAGRRPDVSCVKGADVVGAAEVCHTHAVGIEKKRDLAAASLKWFEAAATSLLLGHCFKHIEAADILSIDAVGAGVTYPEPPRYCEPCAVEWARRQEIAAQRQREEEAERARRVEEEIQLKRVRDAQWRREEAVNLERQRQEVFAQAHRNEEERRRRKSEWERYKAKLAPGSDALLLAVEVERQGVMPEVDRYGIRLAVKMSGSLYIAVANYRRTSFEQVKRTVAAVED